LRELRKACRKNDNDKHLSPSGHESSCDALILSSEIK
jgi:hypothetical protein